MADVVPMRGPVHGCCPVRLRRVDVGTLLHEGPQRRDGASLSSVCDR